MSAVIQPDPAILELARRLARQAAREAFAAATTPSAEPQGHSEAERPSKPEPQY